MRFIEKGPEPQELIDHKNLENENWHPTFGELHSNVKQAIYKSLLDEQQHICCYCESRLELNDFHIEHVNPQHLPDVDPLDYTNMACSCLRPTKIEKTALKPKLPLHCGHSKGKKQILIKPFDIDCETHFTYTDDGQILPVEDDVAAKKTVNILALDIDKLNSLRSEAVSVYIDPNKDEDTIKLEMEQDMLPKDGKLPAFISIIKYHYNAWYTEQMHAMP